MAGASVAEERAAEGVALGTSGPRRCDIDQVSGQLQSTGKTLHGVYAAGPWGDGLSRALTQKPLKCWGVAPSQIPKTAGARVKTNRRNAVQLARRLRSGALTPL
jgi:hypothetical protein